MIPLFKIKSFALVLLKRFCLETSGSTNQSILSTLTDPNIQQIKDNLLISLQSTTLTPPTRRKLCYTITDIAQHMSDKGSEWQQLQVVSYQLASSTNHLFR